ncbi:hypothetical protein [Terasakiella sp. SH-1]|uniref:hypothetical protein n=1 Tax=Terasakiella sp. SH-1 TaxID=2560057 RepID=UPI001074514A|nr:hypothetical protein [Terasakiella sp. SH-1]
MPANKLPNLKKKNTRRRGLGIAPPTELEAGNNLNDPEIGMEAPARPARVEMVKDSYSMPKADYEIIDELTFRMAAQKRRVYKAEILRAGLHALKALPDDKMLSVLDGLVKLKKGPDKSV